MLGRASPGMVRIWALPMLTRFIRVEIDLSLLYGYFNGDSKMMIHIKSESTGNLTSSSITGESGVRLRLGVLDDALGFGGHELANAEALLPGAGVVPFGLERIGRLVEEAVIGSNHAPLCAIHEHRHAAEVGFELIAERPDEIGAHQTDSVAEDFGMNGIVDQRANRLAGRGDGLDNAHARVV